MVRQQTRQTIDGYAIHIKAHKSNRRRDLDNILKATSDLLVNLNIIDDSQCVALAAEWAKETTAPMVVTLIPMEPEDDTEHQILQ